MRCLYCGKELALLKRWTGGGEFCSDAHRQRYQEEYNQLALKRLLQAQPGENTADSKIEAKSGEAKSGESKPKPRPELRPEPAIETNSEPQRERRDRHVEQRDRHVERTPEPEPAVAYAKREERHEQPAIAVAERPPVTQPVQEEAEPPAPLGEYIREVPQPAFVEVADLVRGELEWMSATTPALPERAAGSPIDFSTVQLAAGEQVSLSVGTRFRDCESSPRERRLEIRDFVRAVPIVEVNLMGTEETILEMATQPLEIVIPPRAPAEAVGLWQEGAREFKAPEIELGKLTRLAFATTGLQDNLESVEPIGEIAPHVEEPVSAGAEVEEVEEVEVAVATSHESEPEVLPDPVAMQAETLVEVPQPVEEATVAVEPQVEVAVELPVVPEPVREPQPELVRRAVPLTLHGLAPGRGKPVQVFTAALAGGVAVQLPRSNALPLRPLMVLGPRLAPAQTQASPGAKVTESKQVEVKAEVKTEVKVAAQPQPEVKVEPKPESKPEIKKAAPPAKPDPRANGKNRKPGVRVITPEEAPAEKKAEPQKEAAKAEPTKAEPVKAEPVKQETIKPETARPEPVKPTVAAYEPPAPKYAPLAAPLTTVDLGLPKLELNASQSGWSRMSSGAKIGIAALAALVLAGVVLFMMKGGSGSARAEGAPRVVEAGPALPITESGWITNWGAGEAGVRKTHDISILRPSLNLTDYRVDLQAQIESKGMGWIVRAMNNKNYYVLRLEIVKPGLEPTVQFVRYAMVGGEEKSRVSRPLGFQVRIDTMYKIRTEVVGSHITTWIQEQKIDDWTDDQVKTGGAGLYYERGERASLKGGLSVVPLILKN